jgi:hypothetical protein
VRYSKIRFNKFSLISNKNRTHISNKDKIAYHNTLKIMPDRSHLYGNLKLISIILQTLTKFYFKKNDGHMF